MQHLPSAKRFIFADSFNYEQNEYERENTDERSNLNEENYSNLLEIGYSLNNSYFISITQRFHIESSYKRDNDINQHSYSKFSDPKITLIKRLPKNDLLAPLLDLTISASPYTGEFQRSTHSYEDNKKKGGNDLGLSLRFGVQDEHFDSTGTFFLDFHGKRKGRSYNEQYVRYGPYSSYGLKINCQYLVSHSWNIGGGLEIQREASISLKDEYPDHIEQDGYSTTMLARVTFIINKDSLLFAQYSSSSTGIIGSSEDLERESSALSLGVKFQ